MAERSKILQKEMYLEAKTILPYKKAVLPLKRKFAYAILKSLMQEVR
jgi:hypothetical protein